jgi:hypothetical protein
MKIICNNFTLVQMASIYIKIIPLQFSRFGIESSVIKDGIYDYMIVNVCIDVANLE